MAAVTNLWRAVTYRGREGQIAWMLHRVTGVGVFLFLALHIIDIFLMAFGPDTFEALLFIYHQWIFRLLIIFGLYFGLLYHALNGLRVTLIDFWPRLAPLHARLWWIQMGIFAVIYVPSAYVMLREMFSA